MATISIRIYAYMQDICICIYITIYVYIICVYMPPYALTCLCGMCFNNGWRWPEASIAHFLQSQCAVSPSDGRGADGWTNGGPMNSFDFLLGDLFGEASCSIFNRLKHVLFLFLPCVHAYMTYILLCCCRIPQVRWLPALLLVFLVRGGMANSDFEDF